MIPHINIWNVTGDMKGSAPELFKRETDTRVTCTVDALKHSKTYCAITVRYMLRMERTNLGNSPTASIKEKGDDIGKSSGLDDEVVQDRDNGMIMISKMRDKINPRKKRLYDPLSADVVDAFSQTLKKLVGRKIAFKVEIADYNIERECYVYNHC
ncbi:hypothetical protein Tco_0133609 [Tanacetum coccineum]